MDVLPTDSHPPITYPIALTNTAGPEAAEFVAFVTSTAARPIFVKYGFQPLP